MSQTSPILKKIFSGIAVAACPIKVRFVLKFFIKSAAVIVRIYSVCVNDFMSGEFDFIEKIKSRAANFKTNSSVRTGIGDDCAVLAKDNKTDLVITTDLLVENIDFHLEWSKPEFIGHKSLAVSLSDIAAMGANPVWSMLSIGVPPHIWKTDFVEKFYDGYLRLAKKCKVELVGGDVSRTPDKIVIDSIAAGEAKKGKAVLRSGAKVGDLIFVTGKLGGAAAGLKLLEDGEEYENSRYKHLYLRQLRPHPQTETGKIIGEKSLATAMIDLSDGLSSDLLHICRASKVGARIFADKIPIALPIKHFNSQISNLELALNGGEDFELLFTIKPEKRFQVAKLLAGHNISQIGFVTLNLEKIELINNESITFLEPKGFRHF